MQRMRTTSPCSSDFSSLGSRSNSFRGLDKSAPNRGTKFVNIPQDFHFRCYSFLQPFRLCEGVGGGVSRIKLVTRLPREKWSDDLLRNKISISSVMAPILAYWDIRGVSWFKAWFLSLVLLRFSKPVDRFHVSIICEPRIRTFEVFGGHIVADTLLLMMFLGLRKLGNICCGHKMFLNKIRNIFCVPDTKFVSATNVARAGKHLCLQQCVLVCQGLISGMRAFNYAYNLSLRSI